MLALGSGIGHENFVAAGVREKSAFLFSTLVWGGAVLLRGGNSFLVLFLSRNDESR
jgi:hypothetical protein